VTIATIEPLEGEFFVNRPYGGYARLREHAHALCSGLTVAATAGVAPK
jgi:hypothetical protein